jgi:hypothetical protein
MAGQTGPKTPNGKANSSQNATKHGMRSRKVIIGDERQEDFDALAAGWRYEYEPEGQAGESLIERVILNDWLLRRAEAQYLEAEAVMAAVPPLERTAEQHHKLELYLRYKTTAERSFYRAFQAVRGLRKDKLKEELDFEKLKKRLEKYAKEAVREARSEAAEQAEAKVKEPRKVKAVGAGVTLVADLLERQNRGQKAGCACEVCRRNREVLEKRQARAG